MNWDAWTEELCEAQECAPRFAQQARGDARRLRQIERKQQEIQRAAQAVRQAYEANPNGTRDELRKQSYQLITGSIILMILLQVLLSVLVKLAVEWFLDHIFNAQEPTHGSVPVPSE